MIKRGLVIFVVVLIVLAIIGLLLPRTIHVERSVGIDRPASLIEIADRNLLAHPLGACSSNDRRSEGRPQ
jgi:hypothetical protein